MIERRNNPRVYESHPVHYLTETFPSQRKATTLDLSIGGLSIETPNDLETGETLEISIAIPSQLIKCKGKVVHVLKLRHEKVKVGVRFEDLLKQDRLPLGEYISYAIEQRSKERNIGRGIIIGLAFSLLVWTAIIYAIIVFFLR